MHHQELSLHPLYLFTEEVKEPALKIKSIQHVATIALALGPKQTREALLPFLAALFHQENLECQITILETLPLLITHIGHSFYSYLILETVMDILCLYDQKEIRDVAFNCLFKILSRIDVRKAQVMLFNTLKELSLQKETRIKELIIRMIAPIFIGLQLQFQQKFMDLFQGYSDDEKEEVRAVVASELNEFIRIMPPAPETKIKTLVQKLLEDKSEKVRIHLVESLILLNQLLGQDVVRPYFLKLAEDKGPKVKCEIYDKIQTLSKELSSSTMSPFLEQIKDFPIMEQQVKNKILNKLPILLGFYPQSLQNHLKQLLLPVTSLQLRSTLAQTLCVLRDEYHLDLLIEQSDNEFKLKLLPRIPNLSNRVQLVRSLCKHKSYRVRLNILANIQTRISDKSQDTQKLLGIVLDMLGDRVAIVRSGAAKLASKIIEDGKLGVEKVGEVLDKHFRSQSWFVRLGSLQVVKSLVIHKAYLKLWESIRDMLNDKAACVRMVLVQIADTIQKSGVKSCAEQVKEVRKEVEAFY